MIVLDKSKLEKYGAKMRLWQGIPTVAITRKGNIFISFYSGGTKECYGNFCVLEKSTDGKTFGRVVAAIDMGSGARAFDPCLWTDPSGRLWWIYNVMPDYAAYACVCDDPDTEPLVFREPVKISDGVIINKPIVLSTGEWLFCASVWKQTDFQSIPPPDRTPMENVIKTSDLGITFRVVGGVSVPDKHFGESMVVERRDGTLDLYTRTRYGIAKSSSYDGGAEWTDTADSKLGGPDSRFCIRRLSSGRLLLVNHKNFTGRNNLCAMLSDDDGQTWSDGLMLDERDYVSYPDMTEYGGTLYIVYDRDRGSYCKSLSECLGKPREILMAKITEDDIIAGRITSAVGELKIVADKLGEYLGADENPFRDYGNGDVREYVLALAETDDVEEIMTRIFRDYGNCCFTIDDSERKIIDDNCAIIADAGCSGDVCKKITAIQRIIEVFLNAGNSADIDSLNSAFIERVRNYIENNISDSELRLDKMSDELHISKFYMCHVFKNLTGTTVSQYINFRRLSAAKRLLVETDRSVVSIGMDVGFLDGGYFSKWFKKSEGVTPAQYRELMRVKRI